MTGQDAVAVLFKKRWQFLYRPGVILILLGSALLLGGCGRQEEVAQSSPEATVKAFLEALVSGQTKHAAKAFDFEGQARANNSDWDSIPSGQRNLIIGQMIEEKAQILERWAESITQVPEDLQVTVQGDQASAVVAVDGVSMYLLLVNDSGIWRISGMG